MGRRRKVTGGGECGHQVVWYESCELAQFVLAPRPHPDDEIVLPRPLWPPAGHCLDPFHRGIHTEGCWGFLHRFEPLGTPPSKDVECYIGHYGIYTSVLSSEWAYYRYRLQTRLPLSASFLWHKQWMCSTLQQSYAPGHKRTNNRSHPQSRLWWRVHVRWTAMTACQTAQYFSACCHQNYWQGSITGWSFISTTSSFFN